MNITCGLLKLQKSLSPLTPTLYSNDICEKESMLSLIIWEPFCAIALATGFPNLFALSMMTGSKSLACKSRFVRLSWLFSINVFNLLLVSFICFSRSSLESRQRIFGRLIFLVLVFLVFVAGGISIILGCCSLRPGPGHGG